MATIGYARVSTREGQRVLDRQLDALRAAGCERVFDDRGSGAGTDRLGLAACLDYLRRECGDMPASALYAYLHADESLKAPGREMLGMQMQVVAEDPKAPRGDTAVIDLRRARAFV